MNVDLLDFDTLAAVKRAAANVTAVPFGAAKQVVEALKNLGNDYRLSVDDENRRYWVASVKDISGLIKDDRITNADIGRALKSLGLETWRKTDGFHVAWSADQLDILKRYFDLK